MICGGLAAPFSRRGIVAVRSYRRRGSSPSKRPISATSSSIAAIVSGILLNSMDAESLRAQQAEQRKLVEQQKKQRAAEMAKQRKR